VRSGDGTYAAANVPKTGQTASYVLATTILGTILTVMSPVLFLSFDLAF
jgi:hypothetical protein